MRTIRKDTPSSENGEAIIEFIGLAAAILIPLAYLILTLAQLQAAVYATEATARQAAIFRARGIADAQLVDLEIRQITTDYLGADAAIPQLEVRCEPTECAAGGVAYARASTTVSLPLLPSFAIESLGAKIPVSADYAYAIDGLILEP